MVVAYSVLVPCRDNYSIQHFVMRISRKKRPKKTLIPEFKRNHQIAATVLMLLDEDGQNLGEMSKEQAIALAAEREVDLVEINPKSDPPVAKLVDFTEFKYQKEKQARKQKAKSHVSEVKGIRLSLRISDHDMEVKANQATKFLDRGDKVKLELILRGREAAKHDIALETVQRFVSKIAESTEIREEQVPTRQGPKITAIIAKK